MEEIGTQYEAEVLHNKKRLDKCDLLCFVFDSSDVNSFSYVVNLRVSERSKQMGGRCMLTQASFYHLFFAIEVFFFFRCVVCASMQLALICCCCCLCYSLLFFSPFPLFLFLPNVFPWTRNIIENRKNTTWNICPVCLWRQRVIRTWYSKGMKSNRMCTADTLGWQRPLVYRSSHGRWRTCSIF